MGELAVVTGASSGIGQAYAARLARDGWDLVVVARRREHLEGLARQLGRDHGVDIRVMATDLARHDQLRALCDELARLPVSMLVNSAALAHYMPFVELAPERADELVQLNVLAPVLLTRAVLPGMRGRARGAVINVASLLAFSGPVDAPGLPARGVYAASKAFLVAFTQVLASELRGTGVAVQAVCPGVVRSEFHARQGIDMSAVPRMEPDLVVQASLLDLERGEVVSLPGVPDAGVLDQLWSAQQEVLRHTRTMELPARYG